MKKKRKNGKKFGIIALSAFVVAVLLSVFSLSHTVKEISEVAVSKTPTAILASAGVSEGRSVNVPVLYYDQKADACVNLYDLNLKGALESRQFEWSECGYLNKQIEQGLVEFELNEQFLPVGKSGELTPNRGLGDITRWFSAVDGKSASYTGTIRLDYKADGAVFSFYKDEFYPLNDAEFSKGDFVNKDGRNHLFAMNFAVPFTPLLSGDETFTINADDDTFVFVGNKLTIDMGGVHDATTGVFQIHENGEVYTSVDGETMAYSGVNVGKDEGSIIRIFHADRDSNDSKFNVNFSGMNLALVDTKLADSGEDEIQVAYDPADPSYVAPLGESRVFKPSSTKGLIIVATIEGAVLIAFSVFTAIMIKLLMKSKR
ncbi:hypothetical protein IKG38_03845 [Candidatus Saccharibacteria bacterium]|nr:hypothetical protein [Candidatus Saccharibacteria bacterium]